MKSSPKMKDANEALRKAQLAEWNKYYGSYEQKLDEAKARLGSRYLLAPENHVQRLEVPYKRFT